MRFWDTGKDWAEKINAIMLAVVSIIMAIASFQISFVLMLYLSFFLLTVYGIKIVNKGESREYSVIIFLATFIAGIILSLFVNLDYQDNGQPFLYSDQVHFFSEARLIASKQTIWDCISFVQKNYTWYKAAYGLFGILGYIDLKVSGEVHFLPLLISVAYVTALIPVFLYHILKLYVSTKASLLGALYYGLFTPIVAYSGYLLRDMHLALVFMVILFWIVRPVTIARITGILFCFIIVFNFRISNSLLVLAMLGLYLLLGTTPKKIKVAIGILFIAGLIYFSSDIIWLLSSTQTQLDGYQVRTQEYALKHGGVGRYLYTLPSGIKEIAIVIYSMLCFPFTSWSGEVRTFPQAIMAFYILLSNIGWYLVTFSLAYFFRNIYKGILKKNNVLWRYLIILFVLYLLSVASNMDIRRTCYVFPFVYIPLIRVLEDQNCISIKKSRQMAVLFATILYTIYIALLIVSG